MDNWFDDFKLRAEVNAKTARLRNQVKSLERQVASAQARIAAHKAEIRDLNNRSQMDLFSSRGY